jgi:uncharacterized membrane protein
VPQSVVRSPRPPQPALERVGASGRGNRYFRLLGRLERAEALDGPVEAAEPFAQLLVSRESLRRFLHGDATGIPLHPILTDVPFGAWFMAMFLDLFPDPSSQRSARRLMGLGILSAAPTAIAGWAEWALADHATKRVGVVHAGANGAAVLIFVTSWTARVRGHQELGVRLARAGAVAAIVGGFLGGHMSSSRRGA